MRPAEVSEPLQALFARAVALEGTARRNQARELNLRLQSAGLEQAPEVAGLLDDPKFLQLEDHFGRSCRAVAVTTLIGFGFPWALHITPEDLQFARSHQPRRWDDHARLGAMVVLTVALGAVLAGLMSLGFSFESRHNAVLMFAGGVLLTAYGVRGAIAPFQWPRRRSLVRTAAWGLLVLPLLLVGLWVRSDVSLMFNAVVAVLLLGAAWVGSFAMPRIEQQP